MSNDHVFVDTNVWVARIFEDHVFHERANKALQNREETLCISGQIIREIVSVCTVTRFLSRPLSWEELQVELDALLAQTQLLNENENTVQKLIELGTRYQVSGKQIHDANLVATMLVHRVTRLITFNPDDFKRFNEIELILQDARE